MAIDINEAREIIESAKKRGMIHAPGEPIVPMESDRKEREPSGVVLPEWLQNEADKDTPRR